MTDMRQYHTWLFGRVFAIECNEGRGAREEEEYQHQNRKLKMKNDELK
jgi:hypothetical protein